MARPNPIRAIMESELPSLTYQRRLQYRPSMPEIKYAYNICNRYLFDNRLRMPVIEQGTRRQTWGYCQWEDTLQDTGSHCTIRLMDKWFCPSWFLQILAHEMVHQYQWDIIRFEDHDGHYEKHSGAHGPDFFQFRERFEHYGLRLKTAYGMKRWLRHQNWYKC
jgi:SprT-like family